MRKAALLAAALAAGAFLPGQGGSTAQQIAQQAQAQADRAQAKAPATPAQQRNVTRTPIASAFRGWGWGAPDVGGYIKRPLGSHKQKRRIQMRLNAKRRARR